MAGIGEGNRKGSRKRSCSESDSDKISGISFTPDSPTNRNPDLDINPDHSNYRSIPNLHSPEDLYIETPVGGGRGTRLQVKRLGGLNVKYEKALKDCNILITEIEKWILENTENESLCFDSIYEGFLKFKKRIARVSQEALIRLVDRKVVDQLAELQIRIESLRKRAEREDRRKDQRNRNTDRRSEGTELVNSPDEVFIQSHPIQGIQSLPDGSNLMDIHSLDPLPPSQLTPLLF